MKRIFTLLAAFLFASASFAQYGQTVTVSFATKNNKGNSNKDLQLVIDGRNYSTSYDRGNNRNDRDNRYQKKDNWNDDDIVINSLQPGQHTIQVYRAANGNSRNNNQRAVYNSTFLVKQGYDLEMTIKQNGQVQYRETAVNRNRNNGRDNDGRGNGGYNNGGYRNGGNNNGGYNNYPNQQYRSAMADADFSQLLQSAKSKWFQSGKVSAVQDAFSNQSYYFISNQVRQLLEIVTAENSRLDLAKLAYGRVVDPANFRQVYDLFSSQATRDNLDQFIRTGR